MQPKRCVKLARRPLTGSWFRALDLKNWKTRLASEHSTTNLSRFIAATPDRPGPRIVYFGETHQVAMHEVRALVGRPAAPIPDPKGSWAILSFETILHNIVNLADPSQQRLIGTNTSELTGKWTNQPPPAPTHELGRVLAGLPDLEGFLFPSSVVDARCLAVFPDKLHPNNSIRFLNEMTGRTEELR